MRILTEYEDFFILEENHVASLYRKSDGVLIGIYSEFHQNMKFNPDNPNLAITNFVSELTSCISILREENSIYLPNPYLEWFSPHQVYYLNIRNNTVDVADIEGNKDFTIKDIDAKIHYCFSKKDFVFIFISKDGNSYVRQCNPSSDPSPKKSCTDYLLKMDAIISALERDSNGVTLTFDTGEKMIMTFNFGEEFKLEEVK